jgi:hypothetical protein
MIRHTSGRARAVIAIFSLQGSSMKQSVIGAAVISAAVLGAAGTASAQDLFLDGDMVRGAQDGAPGPVCVLTSEFQHLEKVVFRFRVRDQNGTELDDKALKSLIVELPSGEKLEGYYGGHPPASPEVYMWVATWTIPASYPSGTLTYKAVATDRQGQSQSWEPLRRVTSQLAVLPGAIEFKKP